MPWTVVLKIGKGESYKEGWLEGQSVDIEFHQVPDDGDQFPLLSSIDPYDGAILSGPQIDSFLGEWNKIKDRFVLKEDRGDWEKIQQMAGRARQEGLQLVFVGD